jgi:hypothetical protein
MSLSGALADLGVVDLVQLPHSGRKSGELVVAAGDEEARLYYDKGRLVHAALGGLKGAQVLVQLFGWGDGRFQFNGEVAAPETSIDMDLHRAVMEALQARDEQAEARRRAEQEVSDGASRVGPALETFVAGCPWALYACLLAPDGRVVEAVHGQAGALQVPELLRASLQRLSAGWPRAGLRRALLEDEQGTVALVRLGGGRALVMVAAKAVAVGVVSMNIMKLAASLES